MKKIKKYLLITTEILIINIFITTNVYAATNPYSKTSSYGTNCTWYAWNMANEKAGVTLPSWGNAKDWYNDAKNDGYSVGTTPKANSIIVWGSWTSYGHVGYIEKIEGNIMHVWDSTGPCIDEEDIEYRECIANGVSEETDKICRANAKRIACKYTITPDEYGITGYIYLSETPKKTTPPISENKEETLKETEKEPIIITKSKNANLSNINISNGDIEFNKDIFIYNIELDNEIDTITITATPEDEKATIKGTGEYKLNEGLNEIKLIVTAENNTTKEYIIEITRKEKIKTEENKTITDNKENIDQKNNKEPKENQINKKSVILIASISLLIIFGISLMIILRKNNKK